LAVQDGELAGVCFLDMSPAFDILDHTLLLEKLELYGFDENLLNWTSNYLTGRTQALCIDGSLSRLLHAQQGVPPRINNGPLTLHIILRRFLRNLLLNMELYLTFSSTIS
jgi:hypothetical protein